MPKDTVYLAMIESGFSPEAYSWARAAGPWQFIASTGKLFGLKQNFWVDERRDPSKATAAAASYLQRLHRDLGNWYLAWAAYNAGGGKLGRMVAKRGTTDFWQLSDGKGLAKETKHYVPKLIACALVAKYPTAFGFSDDEFDYLEPRELENVEVPDATDLEVIARAADIPTEEVRSLNPELKRWCTPPATGKQPYILHLPKGSKEKFQASFAKIAPRERLAFRVHRVKRGDTLSRIAASYHSAPEAILRMNGLRKLRSLRVNTELVGRSGYVPVRPDLEVPAGSPRRVANASSTGTLKEELVDGKIRISYGVQDGDSLWTISQRFSCSVELLRKWNRLPRKAKGLQVGTVLVIWTDAKTTAITARG